MNGSVFLLHVVDSLQCICGQEVEESEHFLSNGPLYLIQGKDMLRKLNQLNIVNVNLETMLFGSMYFKINPSIFKAAHKFIPASGRL